METIRTIINKLKVKALGGAKIPHGMSNPVLYYDGNDYRIATFIYIYNRENLKNNEAPRPSHWMVADINTGEMTNEYDCKKNDFSEADYEQYYPLKSGTKNKPSKEEIYEMYDLFDKVRLQYVNTGKLDEQTYAVYFNYILSITPPAYQRFYKELSNI